MSDFEKYWEENASKESWANKAVAAKIWSDKQAKIDELQKRIDLFDKMILSLRNEFNLWADDTEPFDAIEAQIENLEELLK